jgi:DNA repair photolyase
VGRVEYVEVCCKSALNRVQGMPFKWSLNPYAGCAHACHYCYARAYYQIADHGSAGRDFETRILVKSNMPDILRRELARRSWRGETVAIGTSTDAYQPTEGRYRLTRRAMKLRAVVLRRREVAVLRRLVVVDSVLLTAADVIHGVDRPDPPIQLAAGAIPQLERRVALP